MLLEFVNINYYYEKAKEYWAQNHLEDVEVKEILFEGTAEIVEILDEIKNTKK